MTVFIVSCMYRYFLIPSSHSPLAAYSATLAHCMTVGYWAMMGAFFWSALKHECCAQPSDTVQEEENVEGAGIVPEDEVVPGLEEDDTAGSHPELEDASPALVEVNKEAVTAVPEEAEAAKEAAMAAMADIQKTAMADMADLQKAALADIQKAAMAAMADIQKEVDIVMEQLIVVRRAAKL